MKRGLVLRDLLLLLGVIVLWGLNFIPMIYALEELNPLQLGAARFLLSSLPFIAFVARPAIGFSWILAYAATQGFGQFLLLFIALKVGMPTGIASLLMQVQVFFSILMGVLVFNEGLSSALKLALLASFIGLGCFIVSAALGSNAGALTLFGLGLTISAAFMWSMSNIIVKKLAVAGQHFDPLAMVVWSGLVSGLIFVVLALCLSKPADISYSLPSLRTILSLLYLGLIANGFGYWVWSRMLQAYPVSLITPFSLGVPVVGLLAGLGILGESVSALQWLGSVCILSALVAVVWPKAINQQ